ncbi:MAG: orotidine-5'-phosphate decarboxylase, partial [Acidimicrobiales bacterium]
SEVELTSERHKFGEGVGKTRGRRPMTSADVRGEVRDRLAIALDVDDLVAATRLARQVRPWCGVAKVGLELFGAAGPEAVIGLVEDGWRVFLDLKLHDIPTTVGRAARVLGGLGAAYVNFHVQGGEAMLRAGVEGLTEGAAAAGLPAPVALGVTVLTSETGAPAGELGRRVGLAAAAGCGGVVCAAPDLPEVHQAGPGLVTVVPGTRPPGSSRHDQGRVSTPAEAVAAGADLLVLGRVVTASTDPAAAAAAVAGSVAEALTRSRAGGGAPAGAEAAGNDTAGGGGGAPAGAAKSPGTG